MLKVIYYVPIKMYTYNKTKYQITVLENSETYIYTVSFISLETFYKRMQYKGNT